MSAGASHAAGERQRGAWSRWALPAIGWGAFVAAGAYFARQAWVGARTFEFGDETEKLVAALMIRDGARLYRDVFAHHGPVNYLLPHALVSAFGPESVSAARLPYVVLLVLAAIAIWRSPLLSSRSQRALAVAALLGPLAPIWVLQGLQFGLYHNLAGLLLVVPIAQLALPAILGAPMTQRGAFASGAATGLVALAAYSFGPALALFVTATVVALLSHDEGRRRFRSVLGWALAGAAASVSVVLAWMLAYADLVGFYVYHLYFNQVVYASFIAYDWRAVLDNLRWGFGPEYAVRSLAVLALAAACFGAGALAVRARASGGLARTVALVALFAAALMLNPRGTPIFQANPLVLTALAIFALVTARLAGAPAPGAAAARRFTAAAAVAVALFVAAEVTSRYAISSPHGLPRSALGRQRVRIGESHHPQMQLVRELADPDERILALVFAPMFYLEANRLPASGHFYYLPWQAAYESAPREGYSIDLCRDLRERAPPVVFYHRWKVWDRYSPDEYAACVGEILAERYVPLMMNAAIHVRRDRYLERWRPTSMLLPATRRDREALGRPLRGVRSISVQLGSSEEACLSLDDGAEQASPVTLGPCARESARWYAMEEAPETLALVHTSSSLCADVTAAAREPGTRIIGWRCAGTPNQLLTVEPRGESVNLRFGHSHLCLAPGESGETLEQRACPADRGLWTLRTRSTL